MPILERHEGCATEEMCFGSVGPYWTFLGTPLKFLWMHALAALALALLLLLALVVLRRRGRLSWSPRAIASTVALAAVGAFLLAAAAAPFDVQY